MSFRKRAAKLIDSPFANGIVALVVVFATVYVSYTANNGLPLVPTYRIAVDVPDSGQLVRHADVRIGGARVGQVLEIEAMPRTAHRAPYARLHLMLTKSAGPLPRDSRSEVRVASILGGKYVSLVPGRSPQTIPDDGVLPLSRARPAVDLDQAFRVLDVPTRRAFARGITELGTGFAGRGVELNRTLGNLAPVAAPLQRVLGVLADPETNLGGFVAAAAAATQTLEPVAGQLAALVDNGATTLAAINAADGALGRAVALAPSAEAQTTTTLTHLRPALSAAAAITRDLRPAGRVLPGTLERLDETLRAATPVARKAPSLVPGLHSAFAAVNKFAADQRAIDSLRLLGSYDLATFGASGFVALGGILAAVAPAQLNCNVLGLWTSHLAGLVGDGDANGAWVRVLPIQDQQQTQHASTPASNLHLNAYPNEDAQECEAGNEPYAPGQAIGNPPGNQGRTVPITRAPADATRRAARVGLLARSAR